jgi:hypothetical protein
MPRMDRIHTPVRNALIKAGWTITADPYILQYEDLTLFVDLEAERTIAAERDGCRIVVETKSFVGQSAIHDLQVALGQYEMYRRLLEVTAPDRKLYLAVGADIFATFFQRPAIRVVIEGLGLQLLVVDIIKEEVVQWINSPITES